MSAATVAEALVDARRLGVARLDAQLLLGHILQATRTTLLAHDDVALSAEQQRRWDAALASRAAGRPLAYLLGEKEFFGLRLEITPAVLVPRPETELVVEWAASLIGSELPGAANVADLGTGSGAIALAIKHACPGAQVTASDVSEAALAVALRNSTRLGLPIEVVAGSWWQAFAGQRFDVAVANPPYIDAGDPHLVDLAHEPLLALSPGPDGTAALAEIVAGAAGHLRPGGWLLLEHGCDQADAVGALLRSAGFEAVETRADLAGRPRATGGHWPEAVL